MESDLRGEASSLGLLCSDSRCINNLSNGTLAEDLHGAPFAGWRHCQSYSHRRDALMASARKSETLTSISVHPRRVMFGASLVYRRTATAPQSDLDSVSR